jgi:Mg/Co/Ni transporter MgtE
LANVLSRLNARTFWLIPMVCAAIITAAFIDFYKQKDQSTR